MSKKKSWLTAREDSLMRSKKFFSGFGASVAVLIVSVFMICGGASAQETVLHRFNNINGDEPIAGLIFDGSGNLYGTTFYGGTHGAGTVFKLTPQAGPWEETVLYNFNDAGVGGFYANSRLVFDSSGNLYGSTFFGGAFGAGTIFELSPTTSGPWTLKTLHNFDNRGGDGTYPHGGLILDETGNVYGTAGGGGSAGWGIVFELTPTTSGAWTETILHTFTGPDGASPSSDLIFDRFGNLFGTTASGGSSSACLDGCGTVFELSPGSGGGWTETVIHNFNNANGGSPSAGVISDAAGNLYGAAGGSTGNGTVFELMPTKSGVWKSKILHHFTPAEGNNPSTVIFDTAGNLYGPAAAGGAYKLGAIYELTPTASGPWTEKLVYSFRAKGGNGYDPAPGLVFDGAGNLYGAALSGADPVCFPDGCGTVFEITP
jgi:uncharacterized repeat protein (TIGR03803 family)